MPQGNAKALAIVEEVRKAVIGKDECIIKALAAILAGGHILIEDIPGVGKTTLAMAFSRAMDLDWRRTQFTPDVMPADLTGFSIYDSQKGSFTYQKGALMCNLFLADEINRTSPKTQSALLEVMEEGFVTVDGERIKVPEPFIVIATQNPVGSAGTQLLPLSQMDRFIIRMSMGYPDPHHEIDIIKGKSRGNTEISSVISADELMEMSRECAEIYVHDSVYAYITDLVTATRTSTVLELGLSPRGTLATVKMCRAVAFLRGRSYVVPDDVVEVFPSVAVHRICLNAKSRASGLKPEDILTQILSKVPKPGARKKDGSR